VYGYVYDNSTLFGLVERCVACESMTFLVTVLEESKQRLRALLPHGEADKVDDFVTYAETLVEEMRTYFYRNLAPYMLPTEAINKQFALAKWDLTSLATKNNAYCDQIVSSISAHYHIATIPPIPLHSITHIDM
jgi:hypothetical protein